MDAPIPAAALPDPAKEQSAPAQLRVSYAFGAGPIAGAPPGAELTLGRLLVRLDEAAGRFVETARANAPAAEQSNDNSAAPMAYSRAAAAYRQTSGVNKA